MVYFKELHPISFPEWQHGLLERDWIAFKLSDFRRACFTRFMQRSLVVYIKQKRPFGARLC